MTDSQSALESQWLQDSHASWRMRSVGSLECVTTHAFLEISRRHAFRRNIVCSWAATEVQCAAAPGYNKSRLRRHTTTLPRRRSPYLIRSLKHRNIHTSLRTSTTAQHVRPLVLRPGIISAFLLVFIVSVDSCCTWSTAPVRTRHVGIPLVHVAHFLRDPA